MHVSDIDTAGAAAALPSLQCEGGELHRAAAWLAKNALNSRADVAILHCVKIEPCPVGARIIADDGSEAVAVTIPAFWMVPGPIVVNAAALASLTRKMGKHPITLSQTEPQLNWKGERDMINGKPRPDNIVIRAFRASFKLLAHDAEQFPLWRDDTKVMTLADLKQWDAKRKAERAAERAAQPPTLSADIVLVGEDGSERPIANDKGKLTLSAEEVAELCGDDLFATVAFTMPDGSTGYVLQWQLDEGWEGLRTVPADGRLSNKTVVVDGVLRGATVRHDVTRAYVLASLLGGAESEPEPVGGALTPAEPVEALSGREIAPAEAVEADASPGDALLRRIAALEALLQSQAVPEPAAEPEADDVGMFAAALSAESPDRFAVNPSRREASRKIPRERMVRAYLRVRRERALAMSIAEDHRRMREAVCEQRDRMGDQLRSERKRIEDLESAWSVADKAQRQTIDRLRHRRHRAVMQALSIRQGRRIARDAAAARLVDIAAERERAEAAEAALAALERETAELRTTAANGLTYKDRLNAALEQLAAMPSPADGFAPIAEIRAAEAARDRAIAERDQIRRERDAVAEAVGRVEEKLESLLRRALAAENANRALQARLARGDAPVAIPSPAVTWQEAA